MERRPFGPTERAVAVIGQGTWYIDSAGRASAVAALRRGGGPALVSAVARRDCEVYEVSPAGLREILNKYPDLGDVILQAFIARRQLLSESGGFTGLRGSRARPGKSGRSLRPCSSRS